MSDDQAGKERPETSSGSYLLDAEQIELPCDLSPEDLEAKASEAADVQRRIELLEDEKAETSKRIGAALKELTGQLRRLLYELRLRKEEREVRCERRLELPYVCTYRTDTGELVSRRAADAEDRQQGLPSIRKPR